MTPDDRLNAAIAAFKSLDAPPLPSWQPPTIVAAGTRRHSRRRLVMKLGLGGLAALVAISAGLMLAATPAVTMAQAAEAVRAKKLVRYKWEQRPIKADKDFDPKANGAAVSYTCEDLTRRRKACGEVVEANGSSLAKQSLITIDGEAKRLLIVNSLTQRIADALGSGPVLGKNDEPMAHVGIIPKAKLAEALARPGWTDRLSKIVRVGVDPDWTPESDMSELFAEPPLLDRIKTLAESKGSVTTQVQLDGKPAVKIVGTENKRAVTVWLDPATKLPLRIERPHRFDTERKFITVESGFEWDFALPAGLTLDALFSTEPPPGVALTLVVE